MRFRIDTQFFCHTAYYSNQALSDDYIAVAAQ